MANTVTLTFAGESKDIESKFDKVGGAARRLDDSVGASSKAVGEHGNALDKLGEKADNSERNLIGIHDVIDGTATIMKGPGKQGMVAYIQGWADLAGGLAPLLISMAQMKVATLAQATAQKAAAVGARIWAAAQWVMNASLWASPITWIVVAIVALIAVIVLIARHTDWFAKAWRASWGWIKHAASEAWAYIKLIPGWVAYAFGRIGDAVSAPFKAGFNAVARAWNATVGQLSWTVPDWVPVIGGNTISVPHLPTFHAGGRVPGPPGRELLAVLQAGETIQSAAGDAGGALTLRVEGDGALATLLMRMVRTGDIALYDGSGRRVRTVGAA